VTARLKGIVTMVLLVSACAQQPAPEKPPATNDFGAAQDQALALGGVLGDIEVCDGDAWQPPFHEFMTAKRKQGFNGEQTAMIATLVGTAQYRLDPATVDCSTEARAGRAAALEALRAEW
jgi:hypothetical protein